MFVGAKKSIKIIFHFFNHNHGMTIMELIIAMLVSGILLGYGVVNYLDFNKTQTVKNVGLNVKNELRRVQGKSLAGVKPIECGSDTFDGYQISFLNDDAAYCPGTSCIVSQALCGGNLAGDLGIYLLTPDFEFNNPSQPIITLYSLDGGSTANTSNESRLVVKAYSAPDEYFYRMCITEGGDIKDCGFNQTSSYNWNTGCGGCP